MAKMTNNDLQNTTGEINDWTTWTPLKTGGEFMCSGTISSSWYTSDTGHVTLLQTQWQAMNEEMPISDKHGCCGFDIISNKMTAQHVYKTKVDHLMKLIGGNTQPTIQ